MSKKLYVVSGISDQDWERIFSCIRFAAVFADTILDNEDIQILKKIKIRDLDQNKNLKKDITKWLCREIK